MTTGLRFTHGSGRHVATHQVTLAERSKPLGPLAAIPRQWAPRRETAPFWHSVQCRDAPADCAELLGIPIHARNRSEKSARVRMRRTRKDRSHRGLLDDLTGIHDSDPIGDLRNNAQIVRDE